MQNQVGYREVCNWIDQVVADRIHNHHAMCRINVSRSLTDAELSAFRAGLSDGACLLLATLKLHGALEIDWNR